MLPKAETVEQVAAVRAAAGPLRVLALIETARGVEQAGAVAAADGVTRLVFGTLDLALDLDLDIEEAPDGLAYAAGRLAVASRIAGLPAPVAGVTPQLGDQARLLADLAWSRRHGFGAKLCIHPAQVAPIHAALAPDAEAVAWAHRVLAADQAAPRSRPAGRPHDRPPGGPAGRPHPGPRGPLKPLPDRRTAMPSTIIDSAIFQGIFSTDEMRHVWSDENRTAKYLDVEAALAKVQGELGLIPAEAAEEIISHCHLDQIDLPRLREQTERIGYPILGVVTQVNQLCRDGLGEYVHWGATTQDITDTATVLQIREALDLVDAELTAISAGWRSWPRSTATPR